MIIYIDTANCQTNIALLDDDCNIIANIIWGVARNQSEELLSKIHEMLKNNHLAINQITGIIVVSGPGSYTGLRVGIASANALAFSLKIPIWDAPLDAIKDRELLKRLIKQDPEKIIQANYLRPPHISISKK